MPGVEKTENQFRFRIKEPKLFKDDSFRYKKLKRKDGSLTGVSLIIAKLRNPPKGHEGSMVTQSVRFDREKFKDKESVKSWVDAHSKLTKENYVSRLFADKMVVSEEHAEKSL